jgi:3,4-dihydroxy-2-butanone 4-phosphate synthase
MIEYKPCLEEKFKQEIIEAIKTGNYVLVHSSQDREGSITRTMVEGYIKTKSYGDVDFSFTTARVGGKFL